MTGSQSARPGSYAVEDVQALAQAVRTEMRSFHLFELFLGAFLTLMAAAVVGWLFWERLKRKDIRHEREAAVSLMQELDAKTLKRLLGEVNRACI